MTTPPRLPSAVQWLEDLYDRATADHPYDPYGDRDRDQADHLSAAARADTTGRTYTTGDPK